MGMTHRVTSRPLDFEISWISGYFSSCSLVEVFAEKCCVHILPTFTCGCTWNCLTTKRLWALFADVWNVLSPTVISEVIRSPSTKGVMSYILFCLLKPACEVRFLEKVWLVSSLTLNIFFIHAERRISMFIKWVCTLVYSSFSRVYERARKFPALGEIRSWIAGFPLRCPCFVSSPHGPASRQPLILFW